MKTSNSLLLLYRGQRAENIGNKMETSVAAQTGFLLLKFSLARKGKVFISVFLSKLNCVQTTLGN